MSADANNIGCRRYSMVCDNCGITETVEQHKFKPDDAGLTPPFVHQWKSVQMGSPFQVDRWAHSIECARAMVLRSVDRLYGLDPEWVTTVPGATRP